MKHERSGNSVEIATRASVVQLLLVTVGSVRREEKDDVET
jgi:hypothetical protein